LYNADHSVGDTFSSERRCILFQQGPNREGQIHFKQNVSDSENTRRGYPTLGPFLAVLRERYPDLSVEPGGSRRCCFAPIFAIQRTIAASLKRTSPNPKIEKRE
jgi:hypothetical protein